MKKFIIFSAFTSLLLGSVFSQGEQAGWKKIMPSVGLHGGMISYLGDIDGSPGASIFSYSKPMYGLYLEKKIGSIFGISSTTTFGAVSKSQLDNDVFLNFETNIINFDLNLLLDFDNGKMVNESSLFSPFLSVGVGYLLFDPRGDLSSDGIVYSHWSDGSLRDIAENLPGSDTLSNIISRDYEYETTLKDTTTNYSRNTITVPIRFGFKFKLSEKIVSRISAAYILTMTDYLDNIASGGNDNMLSVAMGLQYNFSSPEPKDDRFKDFDFSDVEKSDSDGDGVIDVKDMCQGTPLGVDVDRNGCALDDDEDGVPNYKDKELQTLPGAIVTKDGVTLTDEMIAKRISMKDSVNTEYKVFKAEDLSKEDISDIQKEYQSSNTSSSVSGVTIPKIFQELDSDKDNYISAKEVTNAIDGFFEGENNLSAKDLNTLIDFYFDQ